MQAVLDTNFWLATHVTCVTSATRPPSWPGFLGIVYIVRGVFTHALDQHRHRSHWAR